MSLRWPPKPRDQRHGLGIEDLRLPGGDRDYNDMIMAFELQAVPEPGTLVLIGLGLLGSGARLRRRSKDVGLLAAGYRLPVACSL